MPEGLFGIGEKRQPQIIAAWAKASGSDQSGSKADFFAPRALQFGQRAIEDVAGVGHPQQLSFAHQRPRDDRQDIVAAVAGRGSTPAARPALRSPRGERRRPSDRDTFAARARKASLTAAATAGEGG